MKSCGHLPCYYSLCEGPGCGIVVRHVQSNLEADLGRMNIRQDPVSIDSFTPITTIDHEKPRQPHFPIKAVINRNSSNLDTESHGP
jgi:hypothetical protein